MKKIIIFGLCLLAFFTLTVFGCNQPDYTAYLKELRSDVFEGENENLSLKATYGFYLSKTETSDKEIKIFQLTFKLSGAKDLNASYKLEFLYNGKDYVDTFRVPNYGGELSAIFEVENFTLKEFDVTVITSSDRYEIKLKSTVPKNTLTYKEAINKLWENQTEMMNGFFEENSANTRLIERIIVKDGKPYYYIGIDSESSLKAMLLDGFTGEVLAVRDVF